jgi:hypothetical protein
MIVVDQEGGRTVPKKDGQLLLRKVDSTPGWSVVKGRRHVKIYRDDRLVTVTSNTRPGGRGFQNLRADLKRAGWVEGV